LHKSEKKKTGTTRGKEKPCAQERLSLDAIHGFFNKDLGKKLPLRFLAAAVFFQRGKAGFP
jgi:hypothetical protein